MQGRYIALSGNTGAGKSTLVKRLGVLLQEQGYKVKAFDEGDLYLPHITAMFAEPRTYAFAVQVNFMIQRHLALLEALEHYDAGVTERSHLDDILFVEDYHRKRNISDPELAAYRHMADILHQKLTYPTAFIALDIPPEISYQRVTAAEMGIERSLDYPDDPTKREFIASWYDAYQAFHARIKQIYTELPDKYFIRYDHTLTVDELAVQILSDLKVRGMQ